MSFEVWRISEWTPSRTIDNKCGLQWISGMSRSKVSWVISLTKSIKLISVWKQLRNKIKDSSTKAEKNEPALGNVTVIWTDEAQFFLICFWRLQTQIVLIFYTLYTTRSNLGVCHCIVIEMYRVGNISYFVHEQVSRGRIKLPFWFFWRKLIHCANSTCVLKHIIE